MGFANLSIVETGADYSLTWLKQAFSVRPVGIIYKYSSIPPLSRRWRIL